MDDVIIGTAGHIDHGKTTLLKALTGIDADRLDEEKQRGITIDIGFAHLQLGDFRVGFIDVPGHEKFVKNMLSGIGGIDLVLLVVACDESVMPQTAEHFQICRLLGIPQGVIVLTKKNRVDSELRQLVEAEVRDLAEGSFLEDAPCVAVDSLNGEGLDELRQVLSQAIASAARRSREDLRSALFRMPVDRVFTIRGFGTVVTGTPYAGRLQIERTLQAFPGQETFKVRGIEIFNEKSQDAQAGQRTALNLSGAEKSDLERGMVLAPAGSLTSSHMLDVELRLLADAPQLENRAPIRFHHGSGETLGRIYLLQGEKAAAGGRTLCQVRLETPLSACAGDRFILRRYSPMDTLGGGTVLDPSPAKHRKRHLEALLPDLRELASSADQSRAPQGYLRFALRQAGAEGVSVGRLSACTGLRAEAVIELLQDLPGVRSIPQDPPLAVLEEHFERLGQRVLAFLEAFHDQDELALGASREELKKRFLPRATPAYFQALIDHLNHENHLRSEGGLVGLKGREVRLDEAQQQMRSDLLKAVEGGGWNPPGLEALCRSLQASDQEVRRIYYFLLQNGELVRIREDLVLPAQAPQRLVEMMRSRFQPGQPFSVGDFKDLLGVSRKFAIPYLEFLDRRQVTLRRGDQRVLRQEPTS